MVSSAAPDLSVPVRRELFGGAIEMHVPERFSDISDFRQVPDHQECFADGIIDQSLMVELLDHKGEVRDEESARFFYEDLAQANDSVETDIARIGALAVEEMPHFDAGVVKYICEGTQCVVKSKDTPDAVNVIQVLLACVRLPQAGTDILITMNTPLTIHPSSRAAADGLSAPQPSTCAADALQLFMHALRTLQIYDWGLFGEPSVNNQ
mmetsp:Transcript_39995/g.67063  ORF Transcript_39995/g.67063 Transcript_39995/m.67063 type:complete len:209 (-) Transcript_39995:258-884(-)|eukprot:CAMPEP_0198207612 /NCGR_PEP_ID=MMETSP1445-20131203/11054_1 /TAXON_ID=36898 /ORGANISM="Pyramimonas sp., Strain CCMP2087" /LENGTH=208 /DNA_ID=CAMNT_0043880717 /DNA_START=152 /DNA_END=778 /DNA_ORIENTATION=+